MSDKNPEEGDVQDFEYDSLDRFTEEFLITTRRIQLVGLIDEVTAAHVCGQLQMLDIVGKPIYMYINSTGGCVGSGYAIIDQMLLCKSEIWTITRGQCYSMAAIIAAHGNIGRRYATKNSSFMIHSMLLQTTLSAIEDHVTMTKYLEKDYRFKVKELCDRMKISEKKLKKMLSDNSWLTPKEAMKIGLIDGIWQPEIEQNIRG